MRIPDLLSEISKNSDCSLLPPAGLPTIRPGHILPDDLRTFFKLAGGAKLWSTSDYPIQAVSPREVVPANSLLVGSECPDDISSSWYTIARDQQGNFITVDLDPARLGRCYDSFLDRHGIIGSCPIIATSFADLLEQLYRNRGDYWYWLRQHFQRLGDAYDELDGTR